MGASSTSTQIKQPMIAAMASISPFPISPPYQQNVKVPVQEISDSPSLNPLPPLVPATQLSSHPIQPAHLALATNPHPHGRNQPSSGKNPTRSRKQTKIWIPTTKSSSPTSPRRWSAASAPRSGSSSRPYACPAARRTRTRTPRGRSSSGPAGVRAAPRGPPSNVAVAHARVGGRAAFMGKVGDDEFGNDLVYRMNTEKAQTREVKIDPGVKTASSRMRIEFRVEEGGGGKKRIVSETVKECADDSLSRSEIDIAVLKEARIFHFNSEVLLSPSMHPTLCRAISLSKKYINNVFFDLNLPLPPWEVL